MSKTIEEKVKKIADNLCTPKNEILYNVTLNEVNDYLKIAAIQGYQLCQKEYEERLRWIPVEKRLPEKEGLIILEYSSCGSKLKYGIYDFNPKYFEGKFYIAGVPKRWRYLINK